MTTDELITRARRAIETRQPNLARLYMRKALAQTDAHRRELNPLGWKVRDLSKALQIFGDIVTLIGERWAQAFDAFARSFNESANRHAKSDYALVGPGK
ncbi:hypothetical protein [Arthrobacter sp. S41]|uniref:hypothetical protein n=1 Tax=Arthrobacter sp. S41 TaxID=2509721 RepID=UPI001035A114|nr:hypothetical protein [Arthrobacter sp. S41]TAP26839.1 hypothetical protein EYR88_00265 [Arthrobacter sp. S41]